MNTTLLVAGVLSMFVAVIHSVLGEILIFRRMRHGTLVPKIGKPILRERHVRILWATWHIVTIFGFGFAAILIQAAIPENDAAILTITLNATAIAMLVSSALVCFATNGQHPGWIGLFVVAVLIWAA